MSKTYTTVQGDTWDGIAFSQLGDDIHMDKIMRLNPQYLDFFTFPAGIVLQLPEVAAEDTVSLPPWKQVPG